MAILEPTKSNRNRKQCAAEEACIKSLSLSAIKDGGAQTRVETRQETVNDYADDMLEGAAFPPIIVYHDGTDYWLADGFHRVAAARKIDLKTIHAEIREGAMRDAVLHGIGANTNHGLRRSHADKRRAVERLLTDPEWARWSDRKIAGVAKVDHKTVAKIRRELSGEIPTQQNPGGEIPNLHGKPTNRGSVLSDLIQSVADDVLIAECRRRNLTVVADV